MIQAEYVNSFNLSPERLDEINVICKLNGLTIEQGLSLRKQLMVTKIMNATSKLRRLENEIEKLFLKGYSITKLMQKYDIPPVAMLRSIITNRVRKLNPQMLERDVKDIIKDILSNGHYQDVYLSDYEKEELKISKLLDQNSYSNDPNERISSEDWEDVLYDYLDKYNVNYIAGIYMYIYISLLSSS